MPIIPVALDGLYKVWGRNSNRIRFEKVKIKYGEPFYAKDVLEGKNVENENEKYEIVTAHLKAEIQKMIDEMRK